MIFGSPIQPFDVPPEYQVAHAYGMKIAAAGSEEEAATNRSPTPSYSMSGLLYATEHNDEDWVLLSVPAALVRGVFDGLHEPGIELPLNADGRLDAHITVFRPEEIAKLGGVDALKNDRGKPFRYSLGRLVELEPAGWPDVARVWCLRVHSPELQQLRRSHGLSSLPNEGAYDFHITVATRHRGVLGRNETAKDTAAA